MKYLSATLVLLLAVMFQLWFTPGGAHGDFVLATLIVFAFLFEFWELILFVLLGVFIMNSSVHPDTTMLMLVIIPLGAYVARRYFSLDPWLGAAAGIAVGVIIFYAVVAPIAAVHAIGLLVFDILISALFGELVLFGIAV